MHSKTIKIPLKAKKKKKTKVKGLLVFSQLFLHNY
jgi:hypothetical protein